MTERMLELFEAARRVSVPIVVIRTADQAATVALLTKSVEADGPVVLQWDAARGVTAAFASDESGGTVVNKTGAAFVKKNPQLGGAVAFVDAMMAIGQLLPQSGLLIAHNAHRQLVGDDASAAKVQSVANLRDQFKSNWRTLVLLAPTFQAPPELEQDVVVLDHTLPGPDELRKVVADIHASSKLAEPLGADVVAKAVEAISGLSMFAAEQVLAMSYRADGLDTDALWERKRVAIEQTRGLRVWRGGERFADLVGLAAVKQRLTKKLSARTPIGCVLFLDEIDKVLANVEQDTSGVRMDQLRQLLTKMENNEWRGLCAVGVAGGGKSAIAKAFGNEAGVPTIALDLGDMEGPHVGESEAMIRHAVEVIESIGRGQAYVIATSNNASVMRPELQRRFTDGFFFFDVMSEAERAAAWTHYVKKYDLPAQALPKSEGWTGAEIRNCCREAWDSRTSLVEAAQWILPMATSRAKDIEALRMQAHGTFLDASKPGPYWYDPAPMEKQIRAITLPPSAIQVLQGGAKES